MGIEWVDAIIAAPPCTDFTNSGAQYWPQKDQDGRTAASVELVLQTLRAVEFWKPDWWVIENPIGRLPQLVPELGRARLIFDPCDYAGWITLTDDEQGRLEELRGYHERGIPFTADDIDLVKRSNAYTKRTCLWGEFVLPEKRRVEPIRVCAQGSWLQRLGGASRKTKAARSATPSGFSTAFYEANRWTVEREQILAKWREELDENVETSNPLLAL